MISGTTITRDEARAVGIAALTAAAVALATQAVGWAFEEAKRRVEARRSREKT